LISTKNAGLPLVPLPAGVFLLFGVLDVLGMLIRCHT